jgi:hypothetical protein
VAVATIQPMSRGFIAAPDKLGELRPRFHQARSQGEQQLSVTELLGFINEPLDVGGDKRPKHIYEFAALFAFLSRSVASLQSGHLQYV